MVNPRHRPNIGLVLGQRRRRWHSIKPTLDGYLGVPGPTVNYYISVRLVVNDHLKRKSCYWSIQNGASHPPG